MGLELTLIIPSSDDVNCLLGNSEISLDRDREFFSYLIEKTKGKRHRIKSIEGRHYYNRLKDVYCYGTMTEDQYGQPLCYVKADQLAEVFNEYKSEYSLNKATGQFLKTLPKDYPIILYWH